MLCKVSKAKFFERSFCVLSFNGHMPTEMRASRKVIYVVRNFLRLAPFSATMERGTGVHELQVPLPGPDQFRVVLAQEFAHASNARSPLTVLLFRLPNWSAGKRTELARMLLVIIRRDEGLFQAS